MKKIISLSLLFMFIGLTGTGCSSDDDSNVSSEIVDEIVGTWKVISRTVTNTQLGSVDTSMGCDGSELHIFKPQTGINNRGIYEYVPYYESGTNGCEIQPTEYYEWSRSLTATNVYTLYFQSEQNLFNVVFSNNNTRMTRTFIDNYYIIETVFQKQ